MPSDTLLSSIKNTPNGRALKSDGLHTMSQVPTDIISKHLLPSSRCPRAHFTPAAQATTAQSGESREPEVLRAPLTR